MPEAGWLAAVYRECRRELFLAAWTVLRRTDLAEDAVHAAFVKLARLGSAPQNARQYALRAVRNAAIDLLKGESRRREEPWFAAAEEAIDSPDAFDGETLAQVTVQLERLDPPSREVIELRLHAGLSFAEIATLLDEPLPTVASRYRRAIDKLSKEMKAHHE